MLTCKQVGDSITEYMEKTAPTAARFAIFRHLLTCPRCRAYLRQMRATVALLGRVGREENVVTPPSRAALLSMFEAWTPPEATGPRLRSGGPLSWLLDAAETALGGRRGLLVTGALLVVSLAMLLFARPLEGPPVPLVAGFMCLGVELMAGVAPLLAVGFAAVRARRPLSPAVYASVAAVGGLAGQATLHLSCPEDGMRVHLVAFHFGGVLLAVLLGACLGGFVSSRIRASGAVPGGA